MSFWKPSGTAADSWRVCATGGCSVPQTLPGLSAQVYAWAFRPVSSGLATVCRTHSRHHPLYLQNSLQFPLRGTWLWKLAKVHLVVGGKSPSLPETYPHILHLLNRTLKLWEWVYLLFFTLSFLAQAPQCFTIDCLWDWWAYKKGCE